MRKFLEILFTKLDKLFDVFGGRNIALLGVSLIITIFSLFFNDNWLQDAVEKSVEISQLNHILQEIVLLRGNIYKAESAQRGYLLTHSKDYILFYDVGIDDAKKNLQSVETILMNMTYASDYKSEQALLSKLSADVGAKISEMNVTLEFATNGKVADATKVVKLDSGLNQMNSINANAELLQTALNVRLKDIHQARNVTRNVIRTSVIAGPILLIFLVVLVIKQLLQELADKAVLQQRLSDENHRHETHAVEQSKLLRSLALDYQADVERERHKLARELHDEMGSILTASKMDISWVIKSISKTHPDIVDKLKKTNSYLDQGINFKRQMVQELHPSMISSFGFWPALRSLIDDAVERNKWALTITLPDESTEINETISLVAYRIVQETLNNCNKYAKATELSIHMISDEKHLKIEIQDNGVGLDLAHLDNKTHGLSGMRHRVLAIGGHFEIDSSLGKGLFTRAILPLDVKASGA
ncbi:MAG: histidine kinase [Methylophilales bacterium 28-44-11]|jgi:signal transduction histidine kinase|nr:MAG: histidine kinase [Methylophilales bacterium 28-44-11]